VPQDPRTPLVLLAGLTTATGVVADLFLRDAGTVVVHHNLREIDQGVVHRRVRHNAGGHIRDDRAVLELAHGCVSCTLREDMLPLVRQLADDRNARRIVLHLDPALEPEMICWSLRHVLVDDATLDESVRVDGVVTTINVSTWLADATGDQALAECGLAASADDERTVAQVAVGQVEFADALVLAGATPNAWSGARTNAVLDRLAPLAPRTRLDWLDPTALLGAIPDTARRGEVDDAHGPLLRGQPPLDDECGVSVVLFSDRRPFHPERLHHALDALLDGVVRTRARIWVASQPDVALWMESAGGGLRIGHAGPWLAALAAEDQERVDAERRAMASVRWDPYYGDRDQEVVVIAHRADPDEIADALSGALLTDAELAEGPQGWRGYPDPFGQWHADPCGESGAAEPDDSDSDASVSNRKEQQ